MLAHGYLGQPVAYVLSPVNLLEVVLEMCPTHATLDIVFINY
jgi:hypothetical protein